MDYIEQLFAALIVCCYARRWQPSNVFMLLIGITQLFFSFVAGRAKFAFLRMPVAVQGSRTRNIVINGTVVYLNGPIDVAVVVQPARAGMSSGGDESSIVCCMSLSVMLISLIAGSHTITVLITIATSPDVP